MLTLIERIRERLQHSAYVNEAAISHGVVTPILAALGWDTSDPQQVVPEFSVQRGRVDFALFGLGHRASVFIEVKQVGRAVEGDRQLFEYAFHNGVPLCVLTDGREWSFYLPSGQGTYEDRRVYRLQLDDRDPAECERILHRYLSRDRVRDQRAFEDAQRDYRDAAGQREAVANLPRAWIELVAEGHELLLEIVSDKAEALSGYKPSTIEVLTFLRTLKSAGRAESLSVPPSSSTTNVPGNLPQRSEQAKVADRSVTFTLFGKRHDCPNASIALVELLSVLAARDPAKLPLLAEAVRTRTRNHVANSPAEIYPTRPDLARAAEIAPGWYVGLNVSNRDKMGIIRAACDVFGVKMPDDLSILLPNA